MLKRILTLLGETPSSLSAQQYAIALALGTKAEVSGLAGIDLTYIERPMAGGIGAAARKSKLEEKLKSRADQSRRRRHDKFKIECEKCKATFEQLSFEGDALEAVISAAEIRDAIVTGYDTAFHGGALERPSEIVSKLLQSMPRPLIICSDNVSAAQDTMVAYDGSLPAMRAIQIFSLLGIGQGGRVHVTSVHPNPDLVTRRIAAVSSFLQIHNYRVELLPIVSNMNPAEALHDAAITKKVRTLVMGAYGHRGIRELLFGSTTTKLIDQPPCALFVYR